MMIASKRSLEAWLKGGLLTGGEVIDKGRVCSYRPDA
jgi:hypothetical protein